MTEFRILLRRPEGGTTAHGIAWYENGLLKRIVCLQVRHGVYGYGDDFMLRDAKPIWKGTEWSDVKVVEE